MSEEKEYDVVLDVLEQRYKQLYDMTYRCCELEWGAMDFIRLDQMEQLSKAASLWKNYKESEK